ncbi:MAG: amidohydrolase family protein [Candidatus Aminicenantaceae bacterium]
MKRIALIISVFVLIMSLNFIGCSQTSAPVPESEFDIVISNGKVMDPETWTEATANIGVRNGRIRAIVSPEQTLKGKKTIDAAGLVVAPGFIDMHAHEGIIDMTMQAHVLDGVTTMIGGNCGGHPYPIGEYFKNLEQKDCLINYASLCGHNTLRRRVGIKDRNAAATPEQIEAMIELVEEEMMAGALGVSYGIAYSPGSTYEEILSLARVAAKYGGMTSAHARSGEIGQEGIESFREMIQLAKDSGIPLEFSHIGSTLAKSDNMDKFLDELAQARAEGVRISADIYSYLATGGSIGSAIADPGFFERHGHQPQDVEVVGQVKIDGKVFMEPGSRFKDEEQFYFVREKILSDEIPEPGMIAHIMQPEKVKLGMRSLYVMCGSDGTVGLDRVTQKYRGHPRVAGNFARFLGYWMREESTVDLMTALYKTSTQAALFLGLLNKGRIAVGADADIVIFDPDTIIDKSSFGKDFMAPPEGIEYVIVNGKLTVSEGQLVPDVLAGRVVRRTWTIPGYSK